jgi:hypothetical protein
MTENHTPIGAPVTSRQMEFTQVLPDRETQYQKTPVYKTVTRTITHNINETVTDETGNEISNVNKSPTVDVIDEHVLATVDSEQLDQSGNPMKKALNWGDVMAPAQIVLPIEVTPLEIQPEPPTERLSNAASLKSPGQLDSRKAALSAALPDTKVTAELVTQLFPEVPDDIEQAIREQGKWGLGCPGNCGYFWTFTYEEMVPQIIICPVCGVKVNLV